MNKLILFLATGFGAGYLPKAPGTAGSLVGLALFWMTKGLPWVAQVALVVVITALAILIAERAEKIWGQKDCQKIVVDEVAGQMLACLFITPISLSMFLIFIFFRAFDVVKVFPANWAQKHLPGGLGIVADDIVAGLQAGLLFYILFNWRT